MSNVLKVSHQETIRSLFQQGWSQRRIARELGLHRGTVRGYVETLPKRITNVTPGSAVEEPSKYTTDVTSGSELDGPPKIATETLATESGGRSSCEGLKSVILSKVDVGLTAQRIYQDLVKEHGVGGSYEAVKRFVSKLKAREPERVWRMECQPGEKMQVDFGLGAPIDAPPAKPYRSWGFRAVLSSTLSIFAKGRRGSKFGKQLTMRFRHEIYSTRRGLGGIVRICLSIHSPHLDPCASASASSRENCWIKRV